MKVVYSVSESFMWYIPVIQYIRDMSFSLNSLNKVIPTSQSPRLILVLMLCSPNPRRPRGLSLLSFCSLDSKGSLSSDSTDSCSSHSTFNLSSSFSNFRESMVRQAAFKIRCFRSSAQRSAHAIFCGRYVTSVNITSYFLSHSSIGIDVIFVQMAENWYRIAINIETLLSSCAKA